MSCHWMLLITWWWMSHFTNEMGGLAVQHLICFLFGMNPLLWIESVRRILHHGHHGSKTIFIDCHGNQVSGYGLRLAEQGAIAWVWFCSMGHRDRRNVRYPSQWQQLWPCIWWWHFVAVPSNWTSWPESVAKEDCSFSTSFQFSARFPSLILQHLSSQRYVFSKF